MNAKNENAAVMTVALCALCLALVSAGSAMVRACELDCELASRMSAAGFWLMAAGILLAAASVTVSLLFARDLTDHQLQGPAHLSAGGTDDSGHVPASCGLTEGPGRVTSAPSCGGRSS